MIIFYKILNYLQIRYNKIVSQVFPIVLGNLSMRVKYHPLRLSWPSPCGFANLSQDLSNTLFSFYCQYLWWLSSFWRFKSVSDLGHAKFQAFKEWKIFLTIQIFHQGKFCHLIFARSYHNINSYCQCYLTEESWLVHACSRHDVVTKSDS